MKKTNLLKSSLLTVLAPVLLTACATKYITDPPSNFERPPPLSELPPAPSSDLPPLLEPARPAIAPSASLPPPLPNSTLPAAVALKDQATTAAIANDHERAIGLLERALRIAPDDPEIFYDLGNNYLATNQPQQALQMARRGLTLNPTNVQRASLEDLAQRSQ